MFQIIKLALQVFMKPYLLAEKDSCRKFFQNLIVLVKPAAAASKTKIDDKIVAHLETIVDNDVLFDFFFKLVRDQFESDAILFESPDESAIAKLCNEAEKGSPEAISPMVIVAIVTQIISLINALKK